MTSFKPSDEELKPIKVTRLPEPASSPPPRAKLPSQNTPPHCPYCQAILEKRPERKKKCPNCGSFIYVRTLPTTRERVLVTEARAAEIEAEWTSLYENKQWLKKVSRFGISEQAFERRMKLLSDKHGKPANNLDIVNSLLNELVEQSLRKSDWSTLRQLYHELALTRAEQGIEFFSLLQEAERCQLREYKKTGVVKKVEILTAGPHNSCDVCEKLSGKIFTIEKALAVMPIPHPNCQNDLFDIPGWCRCNYNAIVEQ